MSALYMKLYLIPIIIMNFYSAYVVYPQVSELRGATNQNH